MMRLDQLARKTKASLCLGCGKCTGVCPLAELDHGYSPRRLVARALADLGEDGRALVRRCLTCGACEQCCPEGVAFIDFVCQARALLPPEEKAPCPHHQVLAQAARLMAGDGKVSRDLDWITPDLKIAPKGPVLLFVGCLPLYDAVYADLGVRPTEIARSAIRLLNRLGIEPAVRRDEVCCGHDLLWSGDRESYEKLAAKNGAMIAESGAETVVTTCAECARTLGLSYGKTLRGFAPRVVHMATFLSERLGELMFDAGGNGGGAARVVTYQDPCRLGRHMGVTDEPRALLGAIPGVELREMERFGATAPCCGTSGFQRCDAESRLLQAGRLAEAKASGAEMLVTACPKCMIHFACSEAENERRSRLDGDPAKAKSIETVDLTVLIAGALEPAEAVAAEGGK